MADTRQRTLELAEQIAKVLHAPPQRLASETQERTLAYMEASARALGILEPLPGNMATVTYSVGTSGRDFSTITSAEAELDNGALFSSGDDAVLDCYNDSVFDESPTFNGGGTLGLNSITLKAASGEEHDGTAGSGARIERSSGSTILSVQGSVDTTVSFLEVKKDITSNANHRWVTVNPSSGSGQTCTLANLIVHGGGVSSQTFRSVLAVSPGSRAGTTQNILRCIVYDINHATGATGALDGVSSGGSNTIRCLNTTIHGVSDGGSEGFGVASGLDDVRNTMALSCGESDFEGTATTEDYNISSDATANGSNSLTSETVADLVVSIVGGSEDFHLKSGSNAIDAGVDLGTTPTGVNTDIDGRDVDAEGDTWDIGAHEFVSVGGGFTLTGTTLALSTSGVSSGVNAGRQLAGNSLANGVTPVSSQLHAGRQLDGTTAALSVTRPNSQLDAGRLLQGSSVGLTLSGNLADLLLTQGFVLTGLTASIGTVSDDPAQLKASRQLIGTSLPITITPVESSVDAGRVLVGQQYVVSASTNDADLLASHLLSGSPLTINAVVANADLNYSGQEQASGAIYYYLQM